MSSVTIIHLVRKSNGPEPVQRFREAYKAHPAGIDHRLVLACKGFGGEIPMLYGVPEAQHQVECPDTGFDIGTYRFIAASVFCKTDYVCFLNSWSRPLVDGWLRSLMHWASAPGAGIAGCTASHESTLGIAFPNPHIRTNAFCMRRELYIEMVDSDPCKTSLGDRADALRFEAGPHSVTRQVLTRGLRAVVVTNDGCDFDVRDAREAGVFRWDGQAHLMVADNRTDDYQHADKAKREWLQRLAWGETET